MDEELIGPTRSEVRIRQCSAIWAPHILGYPIRSDRRTIVVDRMRRHLKRPEETSLAQAARLDSRGVSVEGGLPGITAVNHIALAQDPMCPRIYTTIRFCCLGGTSKMNVKVRYLPYTPRLSNIAENSLPDGTWARALWGTCPLYRPSGATEAPGGLRGLETAEPSPGGAGGTPAPEVNQSMCFANSSILFTTVSASRNGYCIPFFW